MKLKEVKKLKTKYWAHKYTDEEQDGEIISEMIDRGNVNACSYIYPGDYNLITVFGTGGKYDNHLYLDNGSWVVVSSKGKIWVLDEIDYNERFEDA